MNYKIKELKSKYITENFLVTLKHLSPSTVIDVKKSRKQFKQIKKNNNHKIFVAIDKESSAVIGTASIFVEPKFIHDCGWLAHVEDVVVSEKYKGQGIGKELMKHVIKTAKKFDCYRVILACSNDNVAFYEKLGFHKRGNEMLLDL